MQRITVPIAAICIVDVSACVPTLASPPSTTGSGTLTTAALLRAAGSLQAFAGYV